MSAINQITVGNTTYDVEEKRTTFSSSVSCVTGDTSVTIQDANIHALSTCMVEPFIQSASGKQFAPLTTTITEGQVVYTFKALTEATDFCVRITNI